VNRLRDLWHRYGTAENVGILLFGVTVAIITWQRSEGLL
jgi:hypothetical protein